MSSRDQGNVKPFKLLDSGKYDLDRWNDEFWRRFQFYLTECKKRDIIIQIEIWATYDLQQYDYPFNPDVNVSYDEYPETSLRTATDGNGRKLLLIHDHNSDRPYDFYCTIPELKNDAKVLKYQRAYVDKLLSYSLEYDNILYTIDNEYHANQPYEWGHYWAKYIREKAAEAGKSVHVTEMNIWDWGLNRALKSGRELTAFEKWKLGNGSSHIFNRNHLAVFDHPKIYSYVDFSDNADFGMAEHRANRCSVQEYLSKQPRPINHDKIYGADYGVKWPTKEGINKFWRNILGGSASCRFHRPPTGIGLSELAQANIRAARKFEEYVKPWECEPRQYLLKFCEENEAYLIANPGKAYGLYFTGSAGDGWVKINFEDYRGKFILKWINVSTGEWQEQHTIHSGGSEGNVIAVPFHGSDYGWTAVIVRNYD